MTDDQATVDEWHERLRTQLADATARRQRTADLRARLAEARTAGKQIRHRRRLDEIQRRNLMSQANPLDTPDPQEPTMPNPRPGPCGCTADDWCPQHLQSLSQAQRTEWRRRQQAAVTSSRKPAQSTGSGRA